jgi:hypothetical protein
MRKIAVGSLCLCALALATSVARAEGVDDPVRAQALFDQAVELARGGDYPGACDKLEQSRSLHDGLGTRFHLAGCWQKLGRTASAYALFEQVADEAHDLGQSEREELARARLEALLPKLSRLRIDVPKVSPHTEVRRDAELVPESDWGKPLPVDRGSHRIEVTAADKAPWSTKVDVTEPATIVAVQVPALDEAAKATKAEPAVVPAEKPKASRPPLAVHAVAAPPVASGPSRTFAIVVGGVGLAALGAGILEGAQYLHSNREAKNLCPSGFNCTSDEIQQHAQSVSDAKTARTWAYVGVGVGAAAVVAGSYLFFSASSSPAPKQQRAMALRVAPLVGGGTWGGALHGSF